MQRARRPGRPVTTKWPGGRMQRRGRATTQEPTCLDCRSGDKGFPRSSDAFSPAGNRSWRPVPDPLHSQTHGVRFPPPSDPVPLRGRCTALAAARRTNAPRRHHRLAVAADPGSSGARICRSGRGRGRRCSSGNSPRGATHGLSTRAPTPRRHPLPDGGMAAQSRAVPSIGSPFVSRASLARSQGHSHRGPGDAQ